jgi:uncharacterized protein YeaO (DUF488 family)
MIKTGRVYDQETQDEGYKVLVDRYWPRGVSKEKAPWNEWMRIISPSKELCKWFGHDPEKWEEFKLLYKRELLEHEEEINKLRQIEAEHKNLTLLFSARDEEHNNAEVLKEVLKGPVNEILAD